MNTSAPSFIIYNHWYDRFWYWFPLSSPIQSIIPTSLTFSILAPSRSSTSCGHCGIFLPQCYSNHRVMFILLHLNKRFGIAKHEHQISLWPMQEIFLNHISFPVKRLPQKTLHSSVLFHFTLVYNAVGELKCSLLKKHTILLLATGLNGPSYSVRWHFLNENDLMR